MPTLQLAKPSGGFETRDVSNAEYAKIKGSAGFMSGNQGSTRGLSAVTPQPGEVGWRPEMTPGRGGVVQPDPPSGGGITNPPLTIDTPVSAPEWATGLTGDDKTAYDNDLVSRLESARSRSKQRLAEIQQIGKTKIGATKGFLAKAGALGRSVSGAAEETGIGVLSDISNKITDALREEEDRLGSEEAQINRDVKKEIEARVDKLNELKQITFTNTLAMLSDSRQQGAEARAAAQEGRLDRSEERDIAKQVRQESVDTLNFLLSNFGPEVITKMTTADLGEIETDLNMNLGSLLEGFRLVVEEKRLHPDIESSKFGTDSWTGDSYVDILYVDGTTKRVPLAKGTGGGLQSSKSGPTSESGLVPSLTDKELNANLKSIGYSDADIRAYRTAQDNTPSQSLDPKSFLSDLREEVKITNDERQSLASAGFSPQQIDNIRSEIKNGYYEDIMNDPEPSDVMKKAIREVFGNETTKATTKRVLPKL